MGFLFFLKTEFPKPQKTTSDLKLVDKIMDFNSKAWKTKKEKGLSLRSEIKGLKIPPSLKDFQKDLKACHNLQ